MPYTKGEKMKPDELLDRARKCFKLASEAESNQRERERDDLRFQVPEEQWTEEARRQRQGSPEVPARPILSIPKLDQPVQLVLNQERAAKLGVNIHPQSEDAEEDTAEQIQGIYRAIERDSNAHTVRSWAFERAVKCGRGAYRITTEYDDSGGNPFDQVIRIERILHQDTVYFDPSASKPDFSDGEWALVAHWMPLANFKREFAKSSKYANSSGDEFRMAYRDDPEWVRDEDVLVVEYFYKIHEDECICLMEDGRMRPEDELGEGEASKVLKKRTRDKVEVRVAKITGLEVLEDNEWNGKYIPLIPVIGRELQPYDSERRWTGIVSAAKDGQRLFNYAASTAVEIVALEPKAPYIGVEGQFEGHEEEWQQANNRNFPYLEYRAVTLDGKPAPPPQRAQVDVGRLGPSMQLLQQADQFLMSATSMYDPTLGRLNQKERSGKAILALQQQGDEASSHFMHNLADISMAYEARVILDLIPSIYDRPGRLARTLDAEDQSQMIMLNQEHYMDQQTGRPVPVQPGQMMPQGQQPEVKNYDLRKGVYSVSVSIGKSHQTRLQEGAEQIGEILTARPELMPLIGPLYFKFRDFPGAKEISDLLTKMRDKQMPWLSGDESGQMSPEQAQAQMMQMQEQIKGLTQQLQAAMQEIQTDRAKQEATIAKAQLDAQSKETIAKLDNMTKLMIEQFKVGAKGESEAKQQAHEEDMQQSEMAHEVASAGLPPPDFTFTGPNKQALGGENDQI